MKKIKASLVSIVVSSILTVGSFVLVLIYLIIPLFYIYSEDSEAIEFTMNLLVFILGVGIFLPIFILSLIALIVSIIMFVKYRKQQLNKDIQETK